MRDMHVDTIEIVPKDFDEQPLRIREVLTGRISRLNH